MRPRHLAAALVLAATGCASNGTPMLLPARFDDGGITRRVNVDMAACPLQLTAVRDTRPDPASLGAMGSRPVRAADFAGWARAGMATRLDAGNGGASPAVQLEAEVLKAYVQGVAMSKSVDIVMRVRVSRDAAPIAEALYRGSVTMVNWAGGESEVHGAFAKALASLVDQLRADSPRWCMARPASI